MIFTYTLAYFLVTVACTLIALVILLQLNINQGTEHEIKFFKRYLEWYLRFNLSNMIWIWINFGYIKINGTIFSVINLASICLAAFYWFQYVEARMSSELVKHRAFHILSITPLSIALLLILTTPFTKLVFYYNENNEYIHGPLYPTMFFLAVTYLMFATGHIILKIKDADAKNQRLVYIIVAIFLVFPFAAGLLDIVVENLPVMELSLLLGTVLVYTRSLQSQVFNDSLTRLNNRRAADNYLLDNMPSVSENEPMYFFMTDIDMFKKINDEFGHLEGDRALRVVGKALHDYGEKRRVFVARWGGDEFCIITRGTKTYEPEDTIKEIQKTIDKMAADERIRYPLRLSAGYTKCISPLTSIEKLINNADRMLYEKKNGIHL